MTTENVLGKWILIPTDDEPFVADSAKDALFDNGNVRSGFDTCCIIDSTGKHHYHYPQAIYIDKQGNMQNFFVEDLIADYLEEYQEQVAMKTDFQEHNTYF